MTLRPFISLTLALILALTSQSMAVARGASAATGQMVICTGVGVTAVYIDAQGQPTSAPHICPDAMMLVVAGLPDLPLVVTALNFQTVIWEADAQPQIAHIDMTRAKARAPPFV